MNNTNNTSARMSYENAKKLLYDFWIAQFIAANNNNAQAGSTACRAWVEARKLSQNEIRLEVQLNNTSNNYVFGVTSQNPNSDNVVYKSEKRLNQSDTLISSEYKFFVAKPASGGSNGDTNFRLRTYGNTQDFTAAQAAAIDGELFDQGTYALKVSNDTIIPGRGLYNHHYLPQTQQTAPLGAGSPGDQFRGAEDGAITEEPNILLIGSKTYVPQVILNTTLPVDMGFSRLILIYSGILAQNSTVIN